VDYISEIKEKKPRPLTLRQMKFCEEYINSGNATQSAINAGYSETFARTHIYKMLENASIKSYISEKNKKFVEKIEENIDKIKFIEDVELAKIKKRLINICFSDEKIVKTLYRYKKNRNTKRKELIWIEETHEDNSFLAIKTIETILKIQDNLINLDKHLKYQKLKNKELENKINASEENNIDGLLDVIDND